MKQFRYIILALCVAVSSEAIAWNHYCHKTIAAWAESELTPKAKKEVKRILGGSMVDHCWWLNTLRKDPAMAHTKQWHYTQLDASGKATTQNENDCLVQIERTSKILRERANNSDSLNNAALKTLIHLVSDLHFVPRVRIEGVKRSRNFKYQYQNGKSKKGPVLRTTTWEATWRNRVYHHTCLPLEYYIYDLKIQSEAKKDAYSKGNHRDWAEEMGRDVVYALSYFPEGEIIPVDHTCRMENIIDKNLSKASYRLAALLNDIFK